MSKKINIGNSLSMGLILEFEVAFPGEERLSIEQYLAGSSREMILNTAAFFLGFKNHKSKFDDNKEFLRMQLISSIRKILKNEFAADTDYHYKKVFIYPVLLTHDLQYDTPGFNELIDFWFQDALLELAAEGLFIRQVKPLSIVNIDSLIYHQAGLSSGISLHEMLNLYQENKKVTRAKKQSIKSQKEYERYIEEFRQMRMSKLIPFSMFIDKYFHKQGFWKSPPLLEMVAPALFKEEYEAKEASKS